MATPQFFSGYYGTAAVGSNELALTKWDVTPTIQLVEFKNSQSGTYVVRQTTFSDVSGSLETDYDFANDPFGAPFSLTIGTILTNLQLFLHQSAKSALDQKHWAFASVVIDTTPQSLMLDGKITTRFTFKGAGGAVTPP